MSGVSPVEFIRQVRQEANKVTWGTRKETVGTTVIVVIMVIIASLFFLLVDSVIFNLVQSILGF
ncbi:preprotein translocase subunit SecE [Rickettsiales bacterium]|nr:preprotein translocase subunit SecE [Rickettsiales bacterium]